MKQELRRYFLKLEREGFRIKGIGVRDISHNDEGYFIHFHYALRPFFNPKNQKKASEVLKKMNDIGSKMSIPVKPNWHTWDEKAQKNKPLKDAHNLIDYFSKRHAGQFEHDYTHTSWKFKDIMDEETYMRSFHGGVKALTVGFSRKEKKFIIKEFREFLKREAFELTCNQKDTINRDLSGFRLVRWYIETKPPPNKPPDLSYTPTFEIIHPSSLDEESFEPLTPIPELAKLNVPISHWEDIPPETRFEENQKRIRRLLDKPDIKLTSSEKIDLSIHGKC